MEVRLALLVCQAADSSGETIQLDQLTTSIFEDVQLEDGDIMVILSSGPAVKVHNLMEKNSILVVAQMPGELLELLATELRLEFTPSEHGLYGKTCRPGHRKLILPQCFRYVPTSCRLDRSSSKPTVATVRRASHY